MAGEEVDDAFEEQDEEIKITRSIARQNAFSFTSLWQLEQHNLATLIFFFLSLRVVKYRIIPLFFCGKLLNCDFGGDFIYKNLFLLR